MKVLIVDDQRINRVLPMTILCKQGVAVTEAATGEDALQAVVHDPAISHVLLDISMPGMSGIEVCQHLRSTPRGGSLYVVAYTAHAFPGEQTQIMEAGFDDLLIKPINRESLLKALGLLPACP